MSQPPPVAGLDGTSEGWVAVTWQGPGTPASASRVVDLRAFIESGEAPGIVAIDIPIGLPEYAEPGGRACDRLVRDALGRPRGSSVFSAPIRPVLAMRSHGEASAAIRESSPYRIGISIQAFSLCPKLLEVDTLMTPERQRQIYEAHPEFSFFLMNGRQPMKHGKKSGAGREERLRHLSCAGFPDASDLVDNRRAYGAAADDVIDAMAVCWTGWRIACGAAICVPESDVGTDARGLRMEIWG